MAKPKFDDEIPLIEPERDTDESWAGWEGAAALRRALVNELRDLLDAMPAADEALDLLEEIDDAADIADIEAKSTVTMLNSWRLRLLEGKALAGPVPTGDAKAAEYPSYMGELVARAASLMGASWRAPTVKFEWWADGKEHRYVGRLDWTDQGSVVVKITEARSGDFVCQSLLGQPYEIDPKNWVLDVASDEVDRATWIEGLAKARAGRKGR